MQLLSPSPDRDFVGPSELELDELQRQNEAQLTSSFSRISESSLLTNSAGAVWIPNDAVDIKQRVCVVAHCGRTAVTVTVVPPQRAPYCLDISGGPQWLRNANSFVAHSCTASLGGVRTLRHLGEAVNASV
jgi:hypothetical protein